MFAVAMNSVSEMTIINAIRSRFKIFEESTKPVLDTYAERGIVVKVDGNKKPDEIAQNIMEELNKIKNK